MAFITVIDATVERVFDTSQGQGVRLKESFTKRDGTEGASYYTAWTDGNAPVQEGDKVKVSGTHSVRAREYDDKDGNARIGVDVNINNPRFEAAEEEAF